MYLKSSLLHDVTIANGTCSIQLPCPNVNQFRCYNMVIDLKYFLN